MEVSISSEVLSRYPFTNCVFLYQGDFKYMRGFEPTTTTSMHYLRDVKLARAVKEFLAMETTGIDEAVLKLRNDSAIRVKQKNNNEPLQQ